MLGGFSRTTENNFLLVNIMKKCNTNIGQKMLLFPSCCLFVFFKKVNSLRRNWHFLIKFGRFKKNNILYIKINHKNVSSEIIKLWPSKFLNLCYSSNSIQWKIIFYNIKSEKFFVNKITSHFSNWFINSWGMVENI